jgi:hypothetical protein
MNKDANSTTQFKFLDAKLFVKRIRAHPSILLAHNEILNEIKTFTFSNGARSPSIDNAVIGTFPKHLFTMLKNTDYLGTIDSNPYNLKHYDINYFSLFVKGKQYPNIGLTMDMGHEKTSVMVYNTMFDASGIHHSDTGLQITHDMYINGYFMVLFDLTPDRAASAGHKSHPDNVVRIELRFAGSSQYSNSARGRMIWSLNPNRDNRFFFSPKCSNQFLGPPSLFNGCWVGG